MAKFILSAFADEIDASFDIQLESLKKLGINMLEIRGVDGKSFVTLSDEEVDTVAKKLSDAGITLSSLGSPIGKIAVDGDIEAHKALFTRIMDIGDKLGCKRVRMFSFYPAENMERSEFAQKVYDLMEEFLSMAEKRGFTLCHENEKGIYGQSPENVRELMDRFGGRLKVVLDNGNFPFCGEDASGAYELLKDYVEYMHIKDCDGDGIIVPPGYGNAYLKETLAQINKDTEEEFILTVEPHLMMFTGLSSLSDTDDIKHKYSFADGYEAFEFAVTEIRKMLNDLN